MIGQVNKIAQPIAWLVGHSYSQHQPCVMVVLFHLTERLSLDKSIRVQRYEEGIYIITCKYSIEILCKISRNVWWVGWH